MLLLYLLTFPLTLLAECPDDVVGEQGEWAHILPETGKAIYISKTSVHRVDLTVKFLSIRKRNQFFIVCMATISNSALALKITVKACYS